MAVFTTLSDKDVDIIVAAFQVKDLRSIIGIANGESETTYLFQAALNVIVTIFESSVSADDVETAFQAMERLHQAGIPGPIPIRSCDHSATVRVGRKLVAVVSFLEGVNATRLNNRQARELGRHVAGIHSVLAPIKSASLEKSALPTGLVHGAAWPENAFFIGDTVAGIINYRLRRQDWLISEIADIAAHWFVSAEGELNLDGLVAFVEGYSQRRALVHQEQKVFPILLAAAFARLKIARGTTDDNMVRSVEIWVAVERCFQSANNIF